MNQEQLREVWKRANQRYRQTDKGKAAAARAEKKRKESGAQAAYRKVWLASLKGRAYSLYNNAKQRAIKRGIPFSLTREWVLEHLEKQVCEVSGIPLVLVTEETYGTQNNMQPFSPCIDRVVPKLGYTPENCRVVCCIYNTCKFHWTDEDVMTLVRALYKKEN